jgi:hypothetical protein
MTSSRTVVYLVALGAGVVGAVLLARAGGKAAATVGEFASSIKDGAIATASAAVDVASAAVDAVNPTNPNNIFASGVNAAVQVATGGPDTLGTWLAGVFDPTTRRASEMLREMTQPKPAIDLGTYADTIARDDKDILLKATP